MKDEHDFLAVALKNVPQRVSIANIEIIVNVVWNIGLKLLPAPLCTRFFAEKITPHVVVDSDDIEPLMREEPHCFGPD